MIHAKASCTVPASQEEVFTLIADLTTVEKYHPLVTHVDLVSDHKSGLGATRICHFTDGTSVKEKVIETNDTNSFKVELADYSFPMKEFFAEMTAVPRGDKQTEVTLKAHYKVKYGLVGYLMGVTMMKIMMARIFHNVLSGLDEYIETGQPVKKKTDGKVPIQSK